MWLVLCALVHLQLQDAVAWRCAPDYLHCALNASPPTAALSLCSILACLLLLLPLLLCMQLVPAVTELMVAELLYLEKQGQSLPIEMLINSSGTTRQDGEIVS